MPSIATSSRRNPVVTPARKKKPKVLSNAERQARFRARRAARVRELEEHAALRNEAAPPKVVSLRNAIREGESVDDTLTRQRRILDRVFADYEQLAVTPGISGAQLDTIVGRLDEGRKRLKALRRVAPGRR